MDLQEAYTGTRAQWRLSAALVPRPPRARRLGEAPACRSAIPRL